VQPATGSARRVSVLIAHVSQIHLVGHGLTWCEGSWQCIWRVARREYLLGTLLRVATLACGIPALVMNAKGSVVGIIDIVIGVALIASFAGL
jgi:hypothetical protein